MAEQVLEVEGIPVHVEGEGEDTVVMIHGWPDTYRLWDGQVEALKGRYRCARFTLPGFDIRQPPRPTSLADTIALFHRIVERVSPGRPVVMLMHDWGCILGYQFILRHPDRVARIIGVDIGDTSSKAYLKSLGAKEKLLIMGYQLWLVLAWKIGGRLGDRMSRWLARLLRCRTDPARIGCQMNYPYAILWTGVYGSYRGAAAFEPHCPMLYLYGTRKPFAFHSPGWVERMKARPGCAVAEFDTGHWLMIQRPGAFNASIAGWLAAGAPREQPQH